MFISAGRSGALRILPAQAQILSSDSTALCIEA